MLLQIAPYLGYLASFMLALGLLVNNDLKFRWFNTCGNVAFIIYGIIISAYPVLLTNVILICINVFYLYRIYNRKEYFELIEFDNGGVMVDRFLSFYKEDIANYFPDFNREQMIGNLNFVVLRDLVIANIFSAKKDAAGNAEVILNYTVPKYRDFKVGRYIFDSEKEFLLSKGVRKVYYRKIANEKHKRFLEVTGFSTDEINDQPCIARNI
ncbi:MAG: YgjV family protein [Bacteroidetes bacterium]|nr:YgjV family protein [Bacteroidota bacterium]